MQFLSAFPGDGGAPSKRFTAWTRFALVSLVLLSLFAAAVVAESNNTTAPVNGTSSPTGTPAAAFWGILVTVIGAGLRAAYGRWQNAHEVTDWRQVGMTLSIGFISGAVLELLAQSGNPTLILYATNPAVALLVGVVATDVVEAILKGTLRRLPGDLAKDAGPLMLALLKAPKPTPSPDKMVDEVVDESEPTHLGPGKPE